MSFYRLGTCVNVEPNLRRSRTSDLNFLLAFSFFPPPHLDLAHPTPNNESLSRQRLLTPHQARTSRVECRGAALWQVPHHISLNHFPMGSPVTVNRNLISMASNPPIASIRRLGLPSPRTAHLSDHQTASKIPFSCTCQRRHQVSTALMRVDSSSY